MKHTILAIAAVLTMTACTKTTPRCHTSSEMMATGPAQRLGYTEPVVVQVSDIGCNRFAVIVTTMNGQRCGYIMDYKP